MPVSFGEKALQGDNDLSGARPLLLRPSFAPSALARRSYLYVQGLASIHYPGNYYTRRANLDSYLLAQTFSGEGELEYEGKRYALKTGDGFVIDCRRPHYCHSASRQGWGYHIVHFDGFAMRDYFSQINHGGGIKFSLPAYSGFLDLRDRLFTVNAEISKSSEAQSSRLLTDMLTEILLNMPDFDTGEEPERVKNIREYLDEHFPENISLDGLSARFAVSKYHLCREFKRFTGKSPNEYLIAVRISNAKALLHATDTRVADIARDVGFADYSNFFTIFRKREKLSPAEYRRQWQPALRADAEPGGPRARRNARRVVPRGPPRSAPVF